MFKVLHETYDSTTTVLENGRPFRHILVIEEEYWFSDQRDDICDVQRVWMNQNAQGLDFEDKKNWDWLVQTLAAYTKKTIIPNMKLTYSY